MNNRKDSVLKGIVLQCPDCRSQLKKDELQCPRCLWKGSFSDGVYNLLPAKLEKEKLNEDKIHQSANEPVWRDLLYKKKLYCEKFERMWMQEIITPETTNFLELAGGLCYLSAIAKYHRPELVIWASDVSPLYLATKSRRVRAIMDVNVDIYAAIDAENLPFEDEQFDAVFISHSIHHIGNIEKMFKEVWRVLKYGGRFLGVDIASPGIKKLHEKDINERSIRAKEFGIHEKSLRYKDWQTALCNSGVPEFKLLYEPGPKTKAQRARRIQNLTRKIPIWIKFTKQNNLRV